MESITSDAHTHVEPGPSTVVPSPADKPLKIRWGRTLVACLGLMALLVAGISGALSMLSVTTSGLTWASLAVFGLVIAGLRTLAVRDQNIRRAARVAASDAARATSAQASTPAPELRETTLFDGAEGAPPAPVQKPLTAEELRAAALRVAAKGTADAKLAHTQTLAEGELEVETWEPVEVPVPGYVTAARAASKAEPLAIPIAPKSAGTSIKADQAGVGVAGDHEGVAAVPDVPGRGAPVVVAPAVVAPSAIAPSERGSYALNNLDDVLQRRRA
ncbi:hypothetical protein [Arthrobacter glacialis]|uniref:Uncharacterized protein n=1 Tax=Arthrobacter glacialis TaxID=1664 RepID=A0A2S3ZYT9_ARTGL|nr:hypothetical protein [Arthrobacter glacialis]POH74067.1 hypothetical protein CVS27_05705 [Arthrobacter glacialis]